MVLFHKIFVSIIIIKKFIHTLLFIYFVYIILKANILLSALLAWHWISWLVWSNKPISSPYNTLICSVNAVCCSCKKKKKNKNARWSSCCYFFKHANSHHVIIIIFNQQYFRFSTSLNQLRPLWIHKINALQLVQVRSHLPGFIHIW